MNKNVYEQPISFEIDHVTFQLKEEHDFSWLSDIGEVFTVYDQQDSGNLSFGVKKNEKKYFVKYAGARPMDFTGDPGDAIQRLREAVPVYQAVQHPDLIKLVDHFELERGYTAVFEWFEGECLHAHWSFGGMAKYTHPASPYYRFRQLDINTRLAVLDKIFSFHVHVEKQGYVAVDFYDGSILYNFENDEMKICDIDFYRDAPSINDIGEDFWGACRSKSPEEYVVGAPIDSITNVYNLGAIAFGLIGGETDHSFSKWEGNQALFGVAKKAVEIERGDRYSSIQEFFEEWNKALKPHY